MKIQVLELLVQLAAEILSDRLAVNELKNIGTTDYC